MSFPTTGVLEAFAGALAAPPNASWTRIGGLTADIQRNGSGVGKNNSASAAGGDYWNPATFGLASEVFCTVVTLPTTTLKRTTLYLLTANPGSTTLRNGYMLEWTFVTGAGNDTWTIQRVDNNVKTQLGSTLTGNDIAAGDKIGIGIDASSLITAYTTVAGVWTPLSLTFTDATYTSPGNVGFSTVDFSGGTMTIDDFGGGTTVTGDITVNATPATASGTGMPPTPRIDLPTSPATSSATGPAPTPSIALPAVAAAASASGPASTPTIAVPVTFAAATASAPSPSIVTGTFVTAVPGVATAAGIIVTPKVAVSSVPAAAIAAAMAPTITNGATVTVTGYFDSPNPANRVTSSPTVASLTDAPADSTTSSPSAQSFDSRH